MDVFDKIIELLMYTIPSVVVFLTAIYLFRAFLKIDEKKKMYELRILNQKAALPIRLQAYERLALFLERIGPQNIIHRVRKQGMSAQQLQLAMVQDIRKEFEHNLSQQIYISPSLWYLISAAKDEMISFINQLGGSIPPKSSEKELTARFLQFFIDNKNELPTKKVLDELHNEVKKLY